MRECHPLQSYRETAIDRPDDVLYLEINVIRGPKAYAFEYVGDFLGRQTRIMTRLGPGDDQFAGTEDQCRGLGFAQAHNDGGEASGIEFGVTTAERNLFQIQPHAEVGFELGFWGRGRRRIKICRTEKEEMNNDDDTHKIDIMAKHDNALPVADMFCNRISNVPPNPSAHSNTDPARLGVCCAKLIAPVFVVDRAVAAAIAAVVTSSFAAMMCV